MKQLLLLTFSAVASEAMAQDTQCVPRARRDGRNYSEPTRDTRQVHWDHRAYRSASWRLWGRRNAIGSPPGGLVRSHTKGLRERLLASVGARTINTASAPHQGATLDFDDLQSAKNFRAVTTYGRSKPATSYLPANLHGACMAPASSRIVCILDLSRTRFADESGGLISRLAWLAKFFAISPAEGAQTIIYLAILAGGRQCDWKILSQVSSDHAVGTGVGRPCCFGIVLAQCGFGR